MELMKTFPNKLILKFGLLCIDFTNTLIWRLREEPIEGFKDYSIFIKWGRFIGLLTEPDAAHLIQQAEKYPDEASTVLRRVINLREALYRIIVATINGNCPDSGDLDILNSEISEMLRRTELVHLEGNFDWGWKVNQDELDQMLWPILISASEMLTSSDMQRIGICEGDGCAWLFYDQSRNRSRKWCDMGDCGNRAKARRFYQRKRANNH
jgi:predicted RNA-binding Zn ribbon-like protein